MNKIYKKETFLKLLGNISSQKEIRKYLERFSSDNYRFALIKVGGAILKNDLDNLISSISFLTEVGLIPIIVHGAGPMLSEELENNKIEYKFINGQRVSSEEVLQIAINVFSNENIKLVKALDAEGVKAKSFIDDIFQCEIKDKNLGYVGDVTSLNARVIKASIDEGFVPVISPLGKNKDMHHVNINADLATLAIAREIEPDKVIFLSEVGGIFDENSKLISTININDDYEYLMEQDWLHSGMKLKLEQIKLLTDILPSSSSVSITKPLFLSKELFTDAGSGTLVKAGHTINSFIKLDEPQEAIVKSIVESSFRGKVTDNYFDNTVNNYLISSCNRSVIVLSKKHKVAYMDKFSVISSARGEGLGNAMWKKMIKDNKKVFWRSKPNNVINSFYKDAADGFQRLDDWYIFWIGIADLKELISCIEFAAKQPRTVIYDE
jgi:acetylglutamate kinase